MSRSTYSLYLFSETRKALVVGTDPKHNHTDDAFFLPISQCTEISRHRANGHQSVIIEIPDWLAEEKGLDPSLDGQDHDDDDEDLIDD